MLQKAENGFSKISQQVKAPAAKPGGMSSIPGTYIM